MSLSENELLARIILGTRRKNRNNNLVSIANDILELLKIYKDKKVVSVLIGISPNMINRFLSVLSLDGKIKKYFEEDKVLSVNIAYYIRAFDLNEQLYLIKKVSEGELNSIDIRSLCPLRKNYPKITIDKLVDKLKKSKNIKLFVYHLQLNDSKFTKENIVSKLQKYIDLTGIVSVDKIGFLVILKLTENANKELIKYSREKKIKLKLFLEKIIN